MAHAHTHRGQVRHVSGLRARGPLQGLRCAARPNPAPAALRPSANCLQLPILSDSKSRPLDSLGRHQAHH